MNVGELFVEIGVKMERFSKEIKSAYKDAGKAGDELEDALTSGPIKGLKRLEDEAEETTGKLEGYFKDVSRVVSGIVISQAFYNSLNAIERAAESVFIFRQNLEDSYVAFRQLLGSEGEAKKFMNAMKQFSVDTPFDLETIEKSAQRILARGFDPKQVLPMLEILGDATAAVGGDSSTLDGLVTAFGQLAASPKAQAEELEQFIERGINVTKILNEELGLTAEQVKNIGDQDISGTEVANALLRGIRKNYGGLMGELSNNTRGLISNINDALKLLAVDALEGMFDRIQGRLKRVADFLENLYKIVGQSGWGGAFEQLVPEEFHSTIRVVIASFQSLGESIGRILTALQPVNAAFGRLLLATLGVVTPAIALLAEGLSRLAELLTANRPLVQGLVFAIVGLRVASFAASAIVVLRNAVLTLAVSKVVAGSVLFLRNAIASLLVVLTRNPVIAALTVVAGAILAIAASSSTAAAWLDQLYARLARLAGFKTDGILQPIDADVEDYNEYLEAFKGIEESMEDTEDATKKAAAAFRKFILPFDEVFRIPEKDGGDEPPEIPMPNLPDMKIPKMPEVPKLPELPDPSELEEVDKLPDEIPLPEITLPEPPPLEQYIRPFELIPPAIERFLLRVPNLIPVPALEPIPVPVFSPAWQRAFGWATDLVKEWLKQLEGLRQRVRGWIEGLSEILRPGFPPIPLNLQLPPFEPIRQRLIDLLSLGIPPIELKVQMPPFEPIKQRLIDLLSIGVPPIPLKPMSELVMQFNAGVQSMMQSWNGLTGLITVTGAVLVASFQQQVLQLGTTWQIFTNQVTQTAQQLWTSLEDTFNKGIASVSAAWQAFAAGISVVTATLLAVLQQKFTQAFEKVSSTIQTALNSIKSAWEQHKGLIIGIVAALAIGVLAAFGAIPTGIITAVTMLIPRLIPLFGRIGPAFSAAIKNIPSFFNGVLTKLGPMTKIVVDTLVAFFKAVPSRIASALSQLPTLVGNMLSKTLSKIASFFGNIKAKFDIPGIGNIGNIAGFANGGIVGKDSIVRVGEQGKREAIIPLENAAAMKPFADAIAQNLGTAGGSNGGSSGGEQQIIQVGTLIADERSLRELERRMQVVRNGERKRGAI